MTRPKIALSKAAQALKENWEIIKSANVLEFSVQNELERLLTPMEQTLKNLDTKDKSSHANSQDIYQIMRRSFNDSDVDTSLSHWMQQSAAFFVFLAQL